MDGTGHCPPHRGTFPWLLSLFLSCAFVRAWASIPRCRLVVHAHIIEAFPIHAWTLIGGGKRNSNCWGTCKVLGLVLNCSTEQEGKSFKKRTVAGNQNGRQKTKKKASFTDSSVFSVALSQS
ncbi:hypothetical protein F4809DRAFT_421654 [Biscogniauxia mediterranea]|nr:hypothetical protein F4809DRAFT_421654 [Biscogniauxia mediterranea]